MLAVFCVFQASKKRETDARFVFFFPKKVGKKTTFLEARVHFILKDHWHHQNKLEWNPVNAVTKRPKNFGRNNEVTVLTRVSYKKMYGRFNRAAKKKWP